MPAIDATALALSNGRLYAGTATGEVMVYDAKTREPISTFTSVSKGTVSLLAASPMGTAWIVGPRPVTIRDRLGDSVNLTDQSLIVRLPDDRTLTIDLRPAGVESPVRALYWLGPRLILAQDFGATFYNARTNAIELPQTFLPASIAKDIAISRIWAADPLLLLAKPTAVRRNPLSTGLPYVSLFTAYRFENNRWLKRGGFASNALDIEPTGELNVAEDGKIPTESKFKTLSESVGFDANGVSAIEGGKLLDAPLFVDAWETTRHDLPAWMAEAGRPDPLWFQAAGEDAWWWTGGVLMRQNRTTGKANAFLPWNDAQMIPNAFLADGAGLWVASNVGVRRVDLTDADKTLGYGGFVSVPLGADTERTNDKNADKLVRELYRWRFATPDLAGKDGSRMISEAYKSVGITLGASSRGILDSGSSVHDELKIGDVLSSAKGFAVYIGNGKTVEMKDGVVKNGNVWSRPFASVRRFLK